MNNDSFLIEEKDFEAAKKICRGINDSSTKNRIAANVTAAKLAGKYFEDIEADTETGIHNIPEVIAATDIADIYVKNSYIDVRIYLNESELCVPKSHFESGVLPAAYMFIKAEQDMSSATVTGFITPAAIDRSNSENGFYYTDESSLSSFYDIEPYLSNYEEIDITPEIQHKMYDFIDGKLDSTGELFKILTTSVEARRILSKISKAKYLLKGINVTQPEVQNDISEEIQLQPDTADFSAFEELTESTLEDAAVNEEFVAEEPVTEVATTEYSTSVTPSIDAYEEPLTNSEEELLSELAKEPVKEQSVPTEEEQEIDNLFEESANPDVPQESDFKPVKKKNGILPLLLIVLLIGGGYYGYTKFFGNKLPAEAPFNEQQEVVQTVQEDKNNAKKDVAMPIETVENIVKPKKTDEATSVSIPAIEQNLNASIIVSALKVNWEVPAGYINNSSAKRYFTKVGKVIQLNLKTELLLLSKPPITNKISLELQYNKSNQKFEIKRIILSSGEQAVDNLIKDTVKNALDMNLNINTSTFGNIQGNPVLIIQL